MSSSLSPNHIPIQRPPNETSKLKAKTRSLIINTILSDTLLVIMTLFSKISTVVISVAIARSVTKKSYALASLYFSFIYSLITCFPQEVIRKATYTYSHDVNDLKENSKFKFSIQLCWLFNFIISFLSLFLFYFFGHFHKELFLYKTHLTIYVFSGLLDIYCEPIMIYMNVKMVNKCKCFHMFFKDYLQLLLTYYFVCNYHMDIWAFTMSRLLTSLINALFLFVVSKYCFKLTKNELMPDKEDIGIILKNLIFRSQKSANYQLISQFYSEMKGWFISSLLTSTDKIVLSFFVMYSDEIKAEFVFIQENISYLIKHSISPSEENFFVLLNKLKNYENITTLKLSKDMHTNNYNGDFSFNENQYTDMIKHVKNIQQKYKKETYSYKLLKTTIRLSFIIGLISISALSLLGNEILIMFFTEKWANDTTYQMIKLFLVNFSLKTIASKFTSYSSAIYTPYTSSLVKGFEYSNIFLFIALSFGLSQIDIRGLIYANIIFNLGKVIIGWVFSVKNEIINEKGRYMVYYEMIRFAKEAFLRYGSIVSTFLCIVICYLLKQITNLNTMNQDIKTVSIIGQDLLIIINCIVVLLIEKEDLCDMLRIKIYSNN